MFFTLANKEQYEAAKNDVLGTIDSNLEKMFNEALAFETETLENGNVRIRFTVPGETCLQTEAIILPGSIAKGLLEKK